jgi:hypothetical protein
MRNSSLSLVIPAVIMGALAACHPTINGSGSTSGSTGSSTSSTSSGAGGSSAAHAFKLVGAYWTGSAEAVDRIDPVTGAGTFIGNLGDLHWWSNQLVLDGDATHAYAAGIPATDGPPTLYVLDLESGLSTQTPIAHNYTLGGVTDDGQVIGAYWTGTAEAVDLIDPVTGASAFAGTLGDLQLWSSQLSYDRHADVVHAIGIDPASASQLYSLALGTHASSKVATSSSYHLGGVTATGALVGALWTGSVERVDEIEPATGVGTEHGQLGDLHVWTGSGFTFDAATGVAYAVGDTDTKAQKLYTLDLGTKVSTGVPTTSLYVLARP